MDEEDYAEMYRELVKIISDAKLQWIVDQVEETIILGKLVFVPIREVGSARNSTYQLVQVVQASDGAGTSKPTGNAKLIQQVQEYSALERLNMLLNSLDDSVAAAGLLEETLVKNVSESEFQLTVNFFHERRTDLEFALTQARLDELAPIRAQLASSISIFRESINAR